MYMLVSASTAAESNEQENRTGTLYMPGNERCNTACAAMTGSEQSPPVLQYHDTSHARSASVELTAQEMPGTSV